MEHCSADLTAKRQTLTEVNIQKGIVQGDSLSQLLIVRAMMPLNYVLRKCTGGNKFTKSQEKINHLMYEDDILLITKKKGDNNKNIQSRYKIKIRHRKMENGKRQITAEIK